MKAVQDNAPTLWKSLSAFDAVQQTVSAGWASQWTAVLTAGSTDAMQKLVGGTLGDTSAGEGASKAAAEAAAVGSGPDNAPTSPTGGKRVPDILSLPAIYAFHIDGDDMMLDSAEAKALELKGVTVAHVQLAQRNLEAWLWKQYVTATSSGCHAELYVDFNQKTTLLITEIGPKMTLPFAGHVTQTRTKEALALCTVFGAELFLTHGGADKVTHECIVPAWAARPVSRADQAVFKMSFDTVTLHMSADCSIATTAEELPANQKNIKIEVSVPSLVLNGPEHVGRLAIKNT